MNRKTFIKRLKDVTLVDAQNKIRHPIVIEKEDRILVSTDDGRYFADYYRNGVAWIHPDVEQLAADAGTYWEWENPSAIVVYFSNL